MNEAQMRGMRKLAEVGKVEPKMRCDDCAWRHNCGRVERKTWSGCAVGCMVTKAR